MKLDKKNDCDVKVGGVNHKRVLEDVLEGVGVSNGVEYIEEEEGEEEGVLATEHARVDSRSEARAGNHKHARLPGPEVVLQSSGAVCDGV